MQVPCISLCHLHSNKNLFTRFLSRVTSDESGSSGFWAPFVTKHPNTKEFREDNSFSCLMDTAEKTTLKTINSKTKSCVMG